MASSTGPLVRGVLPTGSAATAYTVPSGNVATIEVVAFTNTTGAPVTVTVNIVPAGGTVLTTNQLYAAQSIAANTMSFDKFPIHLNAGDKIVWVAGGAGVNGYLGGTVMTNSD